MKKLSVLLFFCAFISTSLMSQTQISGKIIDKTNAEPLVGAAVLIEKTTRGVITDLDGNYTFPVEPGEYSIVVSFVGYESAPNGPKAPRRPNANIPTDIEAEEIGTDSYDTLTLRPTYAAPARKHGQRIVHEAD